MYGTYKYVRKHRKNVLFDSFQSRESLSYETTLLRTATAILLKISNINRNTD